MRSEEGGGFSKEGDGGEEEKRRKKGRAKSAQKILACNTFDDEGIFFEALVTVSPSNEILETRKSSQNLKT